MVDLAAKITGTLKPDTFDEYASLFSDDVKVYKNGEMLASSKSEWLSIAKDMAAYWKFEILDSAPSWQGVLVMETINNMPPYKPGAGVGDCCIWARSALYRINDRKLINDVRFLESGGDWGTPDQPH
jgi:hypothetical protein